MLPGFRAVLALALLWGLAGCEGSRKDLREWRPEDHQQPEAVDTAPASPPEEATVARIAASMWQTSCAGCHGLEGRGDGPLKPPVAQIPDFTSAAFQSERSDEELARVIRQGRGMMPPFGSQLNPRGIAVLVRHVRTLGEAGEGEPPGEGTADSAAPDGTGASDDAEPP